MLAKCNLSAVIFSANQNPKPTKELAYCISPGESMQKQRAELDYYSPSMIVLCQMCRNRRKKAAIYPDSAKYADTWYQIDQIISGLHGYHWSTQTSEPFRLTVVFLMKRQNFSSETNEIRGGRKCPQRLLTGFTHPNQEAISSRCLFCFIQQPWLWQAGGRLNFCN